MPSIRRAVGGRDADELKAAKALRRRRPVE
jgi:hypothetical protein